MKDFFSSLFGAGHKPHPEQKPVAPLRPDASRQEPGELYKKGDIIGGKYEVHGLLGKGGFGVVYLVYSHETEEVLALKTFRDELLADAVAREAFKKEALLWVGLEEHPFILAARWVQEVSGRLFVAMDYIAPDDQRRVSLADHLARATGPMETDQALRWAIQFCHGMEHANAHGIKCHRDIKPGNILITQDGTLKIADFGLAAAAETTWRGQAAAAGSLIAGDQAAGFGFSLLLTEGRRVCGTPGYIPPEVYRKEGADVRSDLYSFGLVLWQMATGSSTPPFVGPDRGDLGAYLRAVYERQTSGSAPPVNGVLGPAITRCLVPEPARRYGDFAELRVELGELYRRRTGQSVEVPVLEKTAVFWNNKGASLAALGRHKEAIGCFDDALKIDPRFAGAWNNKGISLAGLGRHGEAISCYDDALAVDPRLRAAWINKGISLSELGRHTEATGCYDHALGIDPRSSLAWNSKGGSLLELGRHEEAINCCHHALEIDPRFAVAWYNNGNCLTVLGRQEEALGCLDRALEIDPRYVAAWNNKGANLAALGRHEAAIGCFDCALEIEPRHANAWSGMGTSLTQLGRQEEALGCLDRALEIEPRLAVAWYYKGACLTVLGRQEEALGCYDRALEIDPRLAVAWTGMGASLVALGRREEALRCYDQALAIDPRSTEAWFNRGNSLGMLGRDEEAIGCFDRALEIEPRYAKALNSKGGSLAMLGRLEEAVGCYDRALKIDPRNALGWISKALAEERLGRSADAIGSYREFIKLAPPQYAQQLAHARQRLAQLQ